MLRAYIYIHAAAKARRIRSIYTYHMCVRIYFWCTTHYTVKQRQYICNIYIGKTDRKKKKRCKKNRSEITFSIGLVVHLAECCVCRCHTRSEGANMCMRVFFLCEPKPVGALFVTIYSK